MVIESKSLYDRMSRLRSAVYGERSDLSNKVNRFNESVDEYSRNGSIKHLVRRGKKNDGEYGKIDNLHAYYDGNQLQRVEDNISEDGNGNVNGNKNGMRSMYLFPGGYCNLNDPTVTNTGDLGTNNISYHYYNKDHLGNNREVISENGVIEQVVYYYPFGTPFTDGSSTNIGLQPYLYGNKELDMMHGLNTYDFGARNYNPLLPMWDRMDPKAEDVYPFSPFAFCNDNPITFVDKDGKKVYLYATTLPGFDYSDTPTHTFIVVTDSKDNVRGYYAYGSETNGIYGAFSGKLVRRKYSQDIIYSGKDQKHLKGRFEIPVPEGMSSLEFDDYVISIAESYYENDNFTYNAFTNSKFTGNCNTSSFTILEKSGLSDNVLSGLNFIISNVMTENQMLPSNAWGFGHERPWTKEEREKALEDK